MKEKSILITGGTGSFGQRFTEELLTKYDPQRIVIYSRDEFKQYMMEKDFRERFGEKARKLRFFIGDVRDKDRLYRAFQDIDYVVHAAAMKQVPACEYNPFEAIKTNIHGAQNIIDAALDKNVSKVVALSTDKAVNPVNLYGGTKLVSDRLFISANSYSGAGGTSFSVVRYGNVSGSRGSVIPYFRDLLNKGITSLPITDERMTRFWMTLDTASDLVVKAIKESQGGETYVFKNPSYKVLDIAKAMNPEGEIDIVGIRVGEKIHEVMITSDDSRYTYEYKDHYVIYPYTRRLSEKKLLDLGGKPIKDNWEYNSGTNSDWLSVEDLRKMIAELDL